MRLLNKTLAIALLITSPALASESYQAIPEKNVELLVEGVRHLDQVGLYRVVDEKAGNLIYILKSQRGDDRPQIAVVPFSKQFQDYQRYQNQISD